MSFPTPAEIAKLAAETERFHPVPVLPRPVAPATMASRSWHRFRLRLRVWRQAARFITLTNDLHHGKCGGRPAQTTSRRQDPSPKLQAAWERAHSVALREAARLDRGRRGSSPTGAQAVASLLKLPADSIYGLKPLSVTQVPLKAHDIAEPDFNASTVEMLEALPPQDSEYYSCESNVVDYEGESNQIFVDLERQYGFVGGSLEEYTAYFLRDDMPPDMWHFAERSEVKAIAGFSTVPKKDPKQQRKLLMQVATNYIWQDCRARTNLGMHGGGLALSFTYPHGSMGGRGLRRVERLHLRQDAAVDVELVLRPPNPRMPHMVHTSVSSAGPHHFNNLDIPSILQISDGIVSRRIYTYEHKHHTRWAQLVGLAALGGGPVCLGGTALLRPAPGGGGAGARRPRLRRLA